MFEKLRYQIWPFVKVYTKFTWWRIRYGGAENIPRKMLEQQMEKNIEHMRQSLYDALRALPDNATEEERQMLLNAIKESNDIERLYREGLDEGKEKT